ncbi:MAG: zinc ABC transporter substrate-binding protein [Phycisphaerae bacterium]|nr:zinc ABC transporter substrate-binding protein [Phycisphaerae bacterium]
MTRIRMLALVTAALLAGVAMVVAEEGATQPTQPAATGPATSAPAPVRLKVLCSTFPIYLFTRNVVVGRDNIQLDLLLPAGVGCPHDYVVMTKDMQTLAAADVLIVNGLGMEESLTKPLKQAKADLKVIDSSAGLTDLLPLAGEEHHRDQAEKEEHKQDKRPPNPHLFASPRQAARVVRNIAEALARLDPAGASVYRANAASYAARLEKLAEEFTALVATLPNRKIVTQHAVFGYLARDAGLEVVAVTQAEPGQEPAAAEMIELVATIRRTGAAAVLTEPQYPSRVAATIAREAGVPSGVLDPVANGPSDAPLDYYEKVMATNLKTLKELLGPKDR